MPHQERPQSTPEDPQESPRRLPKINEKPIVPRWKRWLKVGAVVTGSVFVVATVSIKLLQHYEPGPQPIIVQQPTLESLSSLAMKKGFPQQCLGDPFKDGTNLQSYPNLNVEKEHCEYSGHAEGSPAPAETCKVVLGRDTWEDPYNFGFNVLVPNGEPIYIGKGSQFSDIPATPGVPAACLQENVTFP